MPPSPLPASFTPLLSCLLACTSLRTLGTLGPLLTWVTFVTAFFFVAGSSTGGHKGPTRKKTRPNTVWVHALCQLQKVGRAGFVGRLSAYKTLVLYFFGREDDQVGAPALPNQKPTWHASRRAASAQRHGHATATQRPRGARTATTQRVAQ